MHQREPNEVSFKRYLYGTFSVIMLLSYAVMLWTVRDTIHSLHDEFMAVLRYGLVCIPLGFILFFSLKYVFKSGIILWEKYKDWKTSAMLWKTQELEQQKMTQEIERSKLEHHLLQSGILRHDSIKAQSFAGLVEVINVDAQIQQNQMTAYQLQHYHRLLTQNNQLQQSQQNVKLLPEAPPFREVVELMREQWQDNESNLYQLPIVLCYTTQGPYWGTILDLLSMLFMGKPGRGKSSALLYYTGILTALGADVWVYDPQGAMNALMGVVHYYDTFDAIESSIPAIREEVKERDILYRQSQGKTIKNPLLVLIDEVPAIAGYEEKNKIEDGVMSLSQDIILQWRKYGVFVVLSGQSFPATVIPTITRDNTASRVVFFSSDIQARMGGLDETTRKKLLPLIKRAQPGTAIVDISTKDEPVIGAIPYTEISDVVNVVDGSLASVPERSQSQESFPMALQAVPDDLSVPEEKSLTVFPFQGTPGTPGTGTVSYTEEQKQAVIAARNRGVPRRDICKELRMGKWFYPAVQAILDEYESEKGA